MTSQADSYPRAGAVADHRLIYRLFALYVLCLWFPWPLDIAGTGVTAGYAPLVFAVLGLFLAGAGGPVRMTRLSPQESGLTTFLLCAIGFLMVWCLLSAFRADDFLRVGRPLATYTQAILTLLLMRVLLRSFEAQNRFVNFMLWIAIGVSAYAIAAAFIPPLKFLMFDYGDRLAGYFKHPNQFGIVLAMFLPVLVARASVNGFRNIVHAGGAAIVMLALFLTGSKTNLLLGGALSMTALAITPFLHRDPLLRMGALTMNLVIGTVAIIGATATLAAFNPRAFGVIDDLFGGRLELSGGGAYQSIADRNRTWAYSIKAGVENPVFGEGAGQPVVSATSDAPHSHNAVLDAFRTLGIPGAVMTTLLILVLAAYLVVYVLNLTRARHQSAELRATYIGIALGALSYLVANQMSDSFGPSTSPFLWLFVGQLIVAAKYFFHAKA